MIWHRNNRAGRKVTDELARRRDGGCVFWAFAWGEYPGSGGWQTGDLHTAPVRCDRLTVPHEQCVTREYRPSNVVTLCMGHKDWVEDNPAQAHRMGLIRFSWEP